jgi:putative DNA primase/helicase
MRKISDERVGRQSHSDSEVNDRAVPPAVRSALAIAADYPVFPCDPESKRPLTQRGFKEASQDSTIVARWWRRHPLALIGVPTGTASGLIAIDVDPDGRDWYREHKDALGAHRLHATRRGKHLLYRQNGTEIRNSTSVVADGVDVRGEGGYVIWWPAHGGVAVGEPGDMPRWLTQATGARNKLNGSGRGAVEEATGAEEDDSRDKRVFRSGERNDALSRRAHYYRKSGMSTREIGQALLQYDLEHCEPPYQQTDGKAKVLYIARKKAHLTSDEEDAKRKAETTHLISRTMAEFDEERVDWLWKGFLARNKMHVIAGAGATMKSTLTLSMAATVTQGGKWPDGSKCPRGSVILWTGEDDIADTVKPRFRWAGGDQSRCHVLEAVSNEEGTRSFDPAQDIELLDRVCTRLKDVALIIVDPIVVIVQKDNNSVSDVRRALYPLQKLAEKHHVVILGIQHFNKGSKGKDPVERITGSGAWTQAPRIVLGTAPIVDGEGKDPTRYVFACLKTFAKKQFGGFEYGFEEEAKTEIARTVWGKHLEGTGHTILTEAEGGEDGKSKLGEAMQFLRELLDNGKSVNMFELEKQYKEAGIRWITLNRASRELKVEKMRVGKNGSRWRLPDGGTE